MKNRNLNHSDNWGTPEKLYKELDDEFNFDFDPCPICTQDITPENDGLLSEWGDRNFINPPYSRKLKEAFINRCVEFKNKGKLCVALVPVSTSTKLFHEVILPNAEDIRFIKGRVKFTRYNEFGSASVGGSGMHDSMIIVFDGREG